MTEGGNRAWSDEEEELAVRAYFSMLVKDLQGEDYTGAEVKRALGGELESRSTGAIDWKFGSISAVLQELGFDHLSGFSPAPNYKESLNEKVRHHLADNPATEALLRQASGIRDGVTGVVADSSNDGGPRLSDSHSIGYKELSDADLGRSPKSNQTHIGLYENVLEDWKTAGTKIALLVRECHEPEEVAAPIGPIGTPSGAARSPKLRKGDPNRDLPDGRADLPLALPKIRSSASPDGANLIFGTLRDGRTLLLLVQRNGRWEKELRTEMGTVSTGAVEKGTSRHRKLASLIQRFLDEGVQFPGTVGRNIIYFGPPGTGKSHLVKVATACFTVFRTVFHPEYAYGDFVGTYKPVVGSDSGNQITGFDGSSIDRPISYYAFDPGVLTLALAEAYENPQTSVALVIEEINRGDCAAIFGDFFQLLDRDSDGSSEYPLHVKGPVEKYLRDRGVLTKEDRTVAFPANLSLFATMNTSDQALFPMDSAFKRRWQWKSVSVSYEISKLLTVVIDDPAKTRPLYWLPFLRKLNGQIVGYTRNEDKRVGPWFILPQDGVIPRPTVREKLLFYLWHDVFRGHPEQIFRPDIRTFDSLQEQFDKGGFRAICPWLDGGAFDASSVESPANAEEQQEYPAGDVGTAPRAAETEANGYGASEANGLTE